jgi:multidrug efflux pump subunit AcrB
MIINYNEPLLNPTMTEPQQPDSPSVPSHLGIAGQMAKDFIHSPLSPLLFAAMLLMGVLGLVFTPRQEDPQISVPMVDVLVQYPGASSQQVASLALDPLQRIMSEIPGVEHVYSISEHGQGMVTVQFYVGQQLEFSVLKVHDKLQANMDKIPHGVMPPLVKPKGIDDVAVVNLTLWSEDLDDSALRILALDVLQSLKEIPNTGQSFVVGGRAEQVRVEVIPERLSGFGLSMVQVAQTIQTANSERDAGYVESGDEHFSVYTGTFLRSARDVSQLVVGVYKNAPVYVRDVATVTQGPEETRQIVNYFSGAAYGHDAHKQDDKAHDAPKPKAINGMPAVTIAVAKKIRTNGVSVANDVLAQVEKLKGRLIPDNVHVEVTRNYGQSANDKVNSLIKKLFIATGAVTLLVWFSLGIRPAIVVTLVIPVVILITIFAAWVMGFTIDRVSLFALIFSIGILVDDAIVVIENIYRRWLLAGNMSTETAVDAVREVGNPTILATFTVVAALLPMGFVSGMMGPYMAPIPALGSVAMVFSLFAAFIFTPWFTMLLKPTMETLQRAEAKEHSGNEKLERFYRRILPPLFNSRVKGLLFLAGLIVAFFLACSMFYTTAVEVKMLPLDNKPEFNVFIDMPEGTALPTTANLTYQLAEKIRAIPEVTALQTYVGTSQPFDFNGMVRHYYMRSQPWHADIHIQLTDKHDRPTRSSHDIAIETRLALKQLVEASQTQAKITVVEMPPGPPVLQAVVAEVYGPDDKTRRVVAEQMTDFFKQSKILNDVDNYIATPYNIWKFEVDAEKAVRKGIAIDMINQNLTMALGGFKLGDVKQGTHHEPTYIILQVPLEIRAQLSRLYDLPIPTQRGDTVPLAEIGKFVQIPQDPVIFQKDLRPVEFIVGDSVGIHTDGLNYRLGAPIYGMLEIEEMLKNYTTPDKINLNQSDCFTVLGIIPLCNRYLGPPPIGQSGIEWTGEWTVTYETFRDMGLAFIVALALIYLLVVWLFGNFIVPGVIMTPIPLTLLGIIPGHWLLGAPFTATSMIGWIALAGIIVRNSILLVDYSIHELQRGVPINDAVILACKTRTRPILITALALVAGSSVILYDPIFQGMAISLLFGVLVSTILTLIVIPLGCISIGPKAMCVVMSSVDAGTPPLCVVAESRQEEYHMPLWLRLWSWAINVIFFVVNVVTMAFYIVRALFIVLGSMLSGLWQRVFPEKPSVLTPPVSSAPPQPVVTPPPAPKVTKPTSPATAPPSQPQRFPESPGQQVDTDTSEDIVSEDTTTPDDLQLSSETTPRPTKRRRSSSQRRGIRLKQDLPKSDADKDAGKSADKPKDDTSDDSDK